MPYEGEFAKYRPLQRIADTERVKQLLGRARVYQPSSGAQPVQPVPAPPPTTDLPGLVVAIDGSVAEVPVKNGYPGARVGYCTVASVLLNLREVDRLDSSRPVNPVAFRKTEQPATIDAALPGTNVVIRTNTSARNSFREALYETFHDVVIDEDDRTRLLDTYEVLLALKPADRPPVCPYDEDEKCNQHFSPPSGASSCHCPKGLPIYSTDALRTHERFHDGGSNGEAFGVEVEVPSGFCGVRCIRHVPSPCDPKLLPGDAWDFDVGVCKSGGTPHADCTENNGCRQVPLDHREISIVEMIFVQAGATVVVAVRSFGDSSPFWRAMTRRMP